MADKQKGGVNFTFEDGFFPRTSEWDGLQLQQLGERDFAEKDAAWQTDTACELVYVVSGSGKLILPEKTIALTDGTTFFLVPSVQRCLQISQEGEQLRYMYMKFLLAPLPEDHPLVDLYTFWTKGQPFYVAQDTCGIDRFFASLMGEMYENKAQPLLVRDLMHQTLVMAYRNFTANNPGPVLTEQTVTAVGYTTYAIIRYIDDHLCSLNNLTDMAKDLGYSYNYLSHLFRRKTGMTIQNYVSQKKIEKSKEMLREGKLSITEIAGTLNYDCIQSFSKAFKRVMNMSPSDYRNRLEY